MHKSSFKAICTKDWIIERLDNLVSILVRIFEKITVENTIKPEKNNKL